MAYKKKADAYAVCGHYGEEMMACNSWQLLNIVKHFDYTLFTSIH
jgi:hypothetical protein